MPTNTIEYRGFFAAYNEIVEELITPVSILPRYTTEARLQSTSTDIEALWDTGATITCIKPELWKRLKLYPYNPSNHPIKLSGIGGTVSSNTTIVDLTFLNNFTIECCPVYIADFPGDMDMLIGMDIIGMGDFAVCNTGNITSFTFAIPPFPERLNFAEKARLFNK